MGGLECVDANTGPDRFAVAEFPAAQLPRVFDGADWVLCRFPRLHRTGDAVDSIHAGAFADAVPPGEVPVPSREREPPWFHGSGGVVVDEEDGASLGRVARSSPSPSTSMKSTSSVSVSGGLGLGGSRHADWSV